jgi:hypothetical protein
VQLEGLGKLKKSIEHIQNRTHDLTVGSIVPQPNILQHGPYATVYNFFYIRSHKKKMGVVHHKKHSTKNNYIQTFQKKLFKIQSTVWSHLCAET